MDRSMTVDTKTKVLPDREKMLKYSENFNSNMKQK